MALDPDSLERLVPDDLAEEDATGRETLGLHLGRYEFAARFLRKGRVLDIACGVGYGTRVLATQSPGDVSVLGIDVSPSAIEYARRRYGGNGAEFRACDAMRFSEPEGFDAIVSLETIEHLEDPEAFVGRLVGMLRPGGVLVASVPTTPSVDLNPHHLHDFSQASFRRLVQPHHLTELDRLEQIQRVSPAAVLRRSETRMRELRRSLPSYYARHPGALVRRVASTLRHGFCNRYTTVAWRSPR